MWSRREDWRPLNAITRAYFERRAPLENAPTGADINAILQTPPDAAAISRLSKDPRYNSMLRTTCVATRLSAGHASNGPAVKRAGERELPPPAGAFPQRDAASADAVFNDPKINVRHMGAIGSNGRPADSQGFPSVLPPPKVLRPLQQVAPEKVAGRAGDSGNGDRRFR